ncbi:hypothetical protein PPERSA_05856 [Pseudocohnilembus persalinus]|uniref:EF-hand domain-containing protein n=1 Tax=Pseudocohnilembus persalinus TaxID=266149 RepID=A0A0V0R3Y1_PSEPJ|nr:hypothetical protein PPERSA_05856 [Pseudocohnilembus persalinus]|eukprot:KRX09187.1 hypothetical protein PPERSA_05856 [Pseudocohnilembus persalinus]
MKQNLKNQQIQQNALSIIFGKSYETPDDILERQNQENEINRLKQEQEERDNFIYAQQQLDLEDRKQNIQDKTINFLEEGTRKYYDSLIYMQRCYDINYDRLRFAIEINQSEEIYGAFADLGCNSILNKHQFDFQQKQSNHLAVLDNIRKNYQSDDTQFDIGTTMERIQQVLKQEKFQEILEMYRQVYSKKQKQNEKQDAFQFPLHIQNISREQIQGFKQCFDALDFDKVNRIKTSEFLDVKDDGKIDIMDLKILVNELQLPWDDKEIEDILVKLDVDSNFIDRQKFIEIMQQFKE